MSPAPTLDAIDHAILALLHRDARRPLTELAAEVNLTAAPVKRRIERLERAGVITGYTVVVDHANLGPALEAVVELRITGDADAAEVRRMATRLPEVLEVLTTAGDPDLLVRIRVEDVAHLREAVGTLRRSGKVTGTKTLMVLDRWTRSSE
jgi:Lrp/AsnC family leucine-responsive transcriptional regulator